MLSLGSRATAACVTTPATSVAGAGGSWQRSGEIDDPSVEAQETSHSCGPACARIALQILKVEPLPTQDDLFERTGRTACSVEALARAINEIALNNGPWVGQAVSNPDDDFRKLVHTLSSYVPWIAHLRPKGARIGHLVVVANVASDIVQILDPWRPGTSYSMSLDEFLEHWGLELVWRPTSSK